MSAGMTIMTAVDRIAKLTPTYRSPVLVGNYAAVLSPAETMPPELQEAQRERKAHYMASTDRVTARTLPAHGPCYFVTSYGVLIAWVSLDGRTHFADELRVGHAAGKARVRTQIRHRELVRAVWPDRFALDSAMTWLVLINGRHDPADTFDSYEAAAEYVGSLDDDDFQRAEIVTADNNGNRE